MDREEAIKWLKIMKTNLNSFPEVSSGKKIEALAEAIRLLKNEQSKEPRWIPVSERLPEEDGEYLVTIYDADENYKYMDIAEFEDGIWQYKDYIKVLAWMPLPKPYEPQESEGKDGKID